MNDADDDTSSQEQASGESPLMRAKRVFLAVRELPLPQRDEEADRLCAGDAALRRMVEGLVAADHAPLPFESLADDIIAARDALGSGAMEPSDGAGRTEPDSHRGSRIGRYRILEKIAEGGFGAVYLAEQEEPVRRTVALKVIKLGMDTRQVVARFEQERQALALMDHPNIAKVHDAGATPAGRPFFVMEFCRGQPITSFCDSNRLTIDDRLRLVMQVCQAVQHAHQKGLIHRDIKPSNIIVSDVDGAPVAKVIDFGIAKATQGRVVEHTLHTERGQLMGTPAYMSPEQAMGSSDIDTRTDVYSLGVLLYELVAGETPIPLETLRSTPTSGVQKLLSESRPRAPSSRIRPDSGASRAAAEARGTDVVRLRATLRRELDWIVLKALERERERRYQTAAELAADVERYLAGEAVLAAPPSRWYAFRKSVRRNRAAVIAASLVIAALSLGLIGTILQAREARLQAVAAAAAARAEAERSKELAEVTEFQSRMLARIDAFDVGLGLRQDLHRRLQAASVRPGAGGGPPDLGESLDAVNFTDTATELIDRVLLKPAIGEIELRFADNPRVDIQLRETVGLAYESLGRWNSARQQFDHVLASAERLYGRDGEKALVTRCEIAYLIKHQGDLVEATRLIEEVLPQMSLALGADNEFTLRACSELANLWRLGGRLDDSIRLYRDTLKRFQGTLAPGAEATLWCMTGLAKSLSDHGDLAEAETLSRDLLRLRCSQFGEDHPDTLIVAHNLGQLLLRKQDLEGAQRTMEDVVARRARLLGLGHPRTANSVLLLTEVLEKRGAEDAARARLQDLLGALPADATGLGPRIRAQTQLGVLHHRAGRYADAEAALTAARSLSMAADRPTAKVDQLLRALYSDWHRADPSAGADVKLAEVTTRLNNGPRPSLDAPVGANEGSRSLAKPRPEGRDAE